MLEGVTVTDAKGAKDEYWVEGSDIQNVSQSAASIHGACLVRNKDIRKFLDGIYVRALAPILLTPLPRAASERLTWSIAFGCLQVSEKANIVNDDE